MKRKKKYIIGIDEVGRGCLAGPIVVAALALPLKSNIKNQISKIQIKNQNLPTLKDSKKLSTKQRGVWFKYIKNHPDIFYAKASVSPKVIDRINISQAANLAAARAFNKLVKENLASINGSKVFLDGGLYISKSITNSLQLTTKNSCLRRGFGGQVKLKTIVRGDEKIPAIMLASIVAKVSRDRKMKKLHLEYPHYDFINNVCYGTKKHRRAIKKHGLSPIHRKSFRIKT